MASVRIKRQAGQKTDYRHPSVTEAALVADTLILTFMTTQQRNYKEKSIRDSSYSRPRTLTKQEKGEAGKSRARREDQIVLLEQRQMGEAGILRKSANRKPEVAWSPNFPFVFQHLITSKVNSWCSNHREWASTLGLR